MILDSPELVMYDGVVGKVTRSGVPEMIVDVSVCPYYHKGLEGAGSELAVPMISRGRVIGVFNAESKTVGRFTERDRKFVSTLAGSAAMAVENARLVKQVSDLAVIDELTGAHNYRYFLENLAGEQKRSERYRLSLSLIMIDIDWHHMENSGIEGLARALKFRLYSKLNEDEIFIDGNVLEYRVRTCRVQAARRRKKLPDFPCKSVGIVEYGLFAKTIDERFETEAVSCPPEITNEDYYCIWRFTLK